MSYMTSQLTQKQFELLALVRQGREVPGIYALAQMLGRPYRRVRDHVAELSEAGLINVVPSKKNGRRVNLIVPADATTHGKPSQPELSYNRFWSSPVTGVSNDVFIAGVIAEPTLDDLLKCCLHFGVPAVRKVYQKMLGAGEISPLTGKSVGRMLGNIEIGISRAA